MKIIFKLLSLSLALIMGLSANAQNQVYSIEPFNEIVVSDNFRVELVQSDRYEIQAPAVFTNQNFRVKDGVLEFEKTSELTDFRDVITVYFVSLANNH